MTKVLGVTYAVGAVLGGTVGAVFSTVGSNIKKLNRDVKTLKTEQTAAQRLVNAQQRLVGLQAAYVESPTKKLKTEVDAAKRALDRAEKSAAKWNVTLKNSADVVAKNNAAIGKMEAALARQEKLRGNQARRKEIEGQIMGTVASFAAVAVPVKLAVDFESAFADVKKVVDFANAEEEKGAQADIRNLSGSTGLSASGIAGIYAAAGAAKLATTREELKAFADTAAQMAVAFGMSAEDAGQKMASWRSKMGMSQLEVVALSDAINHLGNNMAADPLKTAEVVERMGAVAKGAGLSAKSIAALSASFVAASPSPEIAATGMKNFLLAMTKGDALSKDQQKALAGLGVGDPKSLAAAMQRDAEGTIMMVMQSISKIPKAQQGAVLSELFGSESLGAIQPLLENLDTLRNAFGKVANEQDYAGSMNEEYRKRSETTGNALLRLRRTMESLAISVGSVVLPPLTAVANAFVWLLKPVTWLAETFPGVTTAAFGLVAGFVTLKVAAMGGAYAATLVSDGWTIARGAFAALRPTVLAARAAHMAHRAAALASIAAAKMQAAVSTALAAKTRIVAVAQWALNAAMSANPIGIVVVAIGALVAWFASAYAQAGSFTGAIKLMWDQFKAVVPVLEVVEAAVTGTVQFIQDIFNGVSLYDAGVKLLGTLWDGLKAMWTTVSGWWTSLKDFLGFETEAVLETAPPPKAAASAVTAPVAARSTAVAPDMMAYDAWGNAHPVTETAKPAARNPAPAPRTTPASQQASGPAPVGRQPSGQSGSMTIAPQITFTVSFNGVPSKDVGELLVGAVKSRQGELTAYFEKMMANIASNQRRLAYDQ